jgi:hypothetical protein
MISLNSPVARLPVLEKVRVPVAPPNRPVPPVTTAGNVEVSRPPPTGVACPLYERKS